MSYSSYHSGTPSPSCITLHYSKLQFPLRVFPALGRVDEAWRGGGAARLYAGVRRPAHLPQQLYRIQMTLNVLACADSSTDVPKNPKTHRAVHYCAVLLFTVNYQSLQRVSTMPQSTLDKSSRQHR